MTLSTISSKGQVTLPAKIRAHLGINTKDKVQILIRDNEIVLKPVKSFRDLRGTIPFKKGNSREKAEEEVAKHVLEMDN